MTTFRARQAVWLTAAFSALLLLGCQGKPKIAEPPAKADAAWSLHLAEHSAGTVARQAPISLRFSHDIVAAEQVGQSAEAVLRIEPTISGAPRFAGPREIVWEHPAPLKAGQEYRATLSAKGLAGVPPELKPYEFAFKALAPDFEVKEAGLETDAGGRGELSLRGQVETADAEDAATVEKLLQASYGERKLALEWVHVDGGRQHHFSAGGIQRADDKGLVRVSWNGAPLGVKREGSRDLEVPARGVFGVLDAAPMADGRQSLRVRFTEALDKKQKLDGLVSLNSGGLTTQIDGAELLIYPSEHIAGEVRLSIAGNLRSSRGSKLGKPYETTLAFANERPQVRYAGKGVILPAGPLSIPIEVMNARAVRVTAFQIYESDVGQFLQTNTLGGDQELHRVGRYLWRKTIALPPGQPDRWNRHLLDAGELLRAHPGALFRLSLSLSRADSTLACPGAPPAADSEPPPASHDDLDLSESSGWDGIQDWYSGGEQPNWSERDDPCTEAYYQWNPGVKAERNFMASNLGLIAKRGADGVLHIAAAAIDSAKPLAGVKLQLRNFQNQPILDGETGSDGMATLTLDGPRGAPFYLLATLGKDIGHLKLSRGTALATSHFDTGGETVEGGIKGFLWGERGVWRPGDEIFLSFLLQDDSGRLPADHPVTVQLFNPQGQLVQTLTSKTPVDRFYRFTLKTAEDAPTGLWRTKALVGGREFARNLRIETVMPNRLKAELAFAKPLSKESMPATATLFAEWLHGASAAGLKADVSVRLMPAPLGFSRFKDYVFDDPTRRYQGEPQTIFEDRLDPEGKARFEARFEPAGEPAATLEADFTTRVFEEGGAFSTIHSSQPYHPYPRYVGLKLPKGDATRGMLLTDQKHTVELATLGTDGEPLAAEALQLSVHKIEWKWWWEKDANGGLADFAQSSNAVLISEGRVATGPDGRGQWQFEIKYPDWGRYLVRVCDQTGGHCAGRVFYADWPGWAGRAEEQTGPGANALYFFADKPRYQVGETALVQLPDAAVGRALLSIETGSRVLEKRWIELTPGKTKLEIPITAGMAPNAYVSLTLIQPHQALSGKDNDRPIRLYGVIPVLAVDPATVLAPVIEAPAVWRPNGKVSLKVKEEQGRAMTYTVAVVDEGLLGLTSYKTPNPHDNFYQREALGVFSWDLYDEVAGAYGGELERLLALGGDEGRPNAEKQEQRRFPPVVKVLGPFRLAAGAFAEHELVLPQTIGALRIMVVAAQGKAYGAAERSVIVREPMSVLATAPRLIGPGEETQIPVTAFAFEPGVKEVKLTLQADAKSFELSGPATQTLKFDQPGDRTTRFAIKVKPRLGVGRLTVLAESDSHRSKTVINLPVLPRNPTLLDEVTQVLAPGEEWRHKITPLGIASTNSAQLSLSAVPPFGLERRLDALVHYPHGCAEQLTSAAFPQLFLDRLLPLEPARQKQVETHIKAAIERLRVYLSPSGGFYYWPGASIYNAWADNYAGHFLAEAKLRGYHLPPELWDAWLARQRKAAAEGLPGEDNGTRAYRLYTLALADKPDVGAMNRLAEDNSLGDVARWQLASAYAQIGLPKAARELLAKTGAPRPDGPAGDSFRSELRDRAMLLDLLTRLGEQPRAQAEAEKLAAEMGSEQWLSTQSAAWGLLSLARYYGADGAPGFGYQLQSGGKPRQGSSSKPMQAVELPELAEGGELRLKNTSERPLTASLLRRGSPASGDEQARAQGLQLEIDYRGLKGETLDERKLPQGRDFIARVTVSNRSGNALSDLALSQLFPSGWQVHNPRFAAGESSPAALDYQDLRDDRVLSYFALKNGESRRFEVLLNASYRGRYYLPASSVEAMYDARQYAHSAGRWVEVVAP